MISIQDKSQCSGCTACESVCAHNAITLMPDAMGFLYPHVDTNKCVDCETTERQAIVQGECKKCELNQILDKKTLQCVDILVIERTKIQISAVAHEACWLCVSPSAMEKCLKYVSWEQAE